MKFNSALMWTLFSFQTAIAAEECKYVLHPLSASESQFIAAAAKPNRMEAAFFFRIGSFQNQTSVREQMFATDLIKSLTELKQSRSQEVEVKSGKASDFAEIPADEIPTENYRGEKYDVTVVRRKSAALIIYRTSDPFKETFTVRLTRRDGDRWRESGALELIGLGERMAKMMLSAKNFGKDSVVEQMGFFGSSEKTAGEVLDILGLATGKDFSSLKMVAIPAIIKSNLLAAENITSFRFRQKLMRLIQTTMERGNEIQAKMGDDDNHTFAIKTGSFLQSVAKYKRYPIVQGLNPQHEYFLSEDTGRSWLMVVDLTLGRATGEIKAVRQNREGTLVKMHVDPMDRPMGEIRAFDNIMDHVEILQVGLFERKGGK